jgi:hypothetical protein
VKVRAEAVAANARRAAAAEFLIEIIESAEVRCKSSVIVVLRF